MTSLDPAYCADGCGRLAETERPMGLGGPELLCLDCARFRLNAFLNRFVDDHATVEDR